MSFFGQTLGLELAEVFWKRRVAFYWIGGQGNWIDGLWEVGTSPQRLSLHVAFGSDLPDLFDAPARLRAANVVPLDFGGQPTDEPVVIGWMPAASLCSDTRMGICSSCFRCCPIPTNQIRELSLESLEPNSRIRSRTADGLIFRQRSV